MHLTWGYLVTSDGVNPRKESGSVSENKTDALAFENYTSKLKVL